MSLLSALNLPVPKLLLAAAPKAKGPPAVPGRQAGGESAGLTDRDFPTDAKHRRREENAAKGGKGADAGKADAKGAKFEDNKDPVDAMIEDAIGDPAKRLEALAKWKVPRFSAEFEDDDKDPALAFLKEMESGTKHAAETIQYIQQMAERAEKFGDATGLENLGKAAGQLGKISKQIGGGLNKFKGKLGTAKDALRWCIELGRFAEATAAMKPADGKSVAAWTQQMQRLWDASAPFAEWANGKLVAAAFAGSEAAAAASATMAIVGAQLFIGIKTLEVGIRNVNAYNARRDEIIRRNDMDAQGIRPPEPPPPPPFPGEWKTRDEEKAEAKSREERGLRQAVQNAKDEQARKKADEARAAAAKFDAEVFPKLYMQNRGKIAAQVLAALRKAGKRVDSFDQDDLKRSDNRSPESRWWDCLLSDQSDEGRVDPQAGVWIHRPRAKVNVEEARVEIDEFLRVKPACPYFVALRNPALAQYLKSQVRL